MQIQITGNAGEAINHVVESGIFATPEAYIEKLVLSDFEQRENARIEKLVLEGLNSGGETLVNDKFFDDLKTRLIKKYGN